MEDKLLFLMNVNNSWLLGAAVKFLKKMGLFEDYKKEIQRDPEYELSMELSLNSIEMTNDFFKEEVQE